MPDVTSIAAILSSIKIATDITKFLRESDLSLERAELKLKLADLVGVLAEAKIELAEIQDTLSAKDKRIVELEEAFQSKESLTRHLDAYYAIDENGNKSGVAFCLRCWENDHKKRQLVNDTKERRQRICTACGHRYHDYMCQDIRSV
jgi:septal ring factor EnvC (AmiA/AmiB activator)